MSKKLKSKKIKLPFVSHLFIASAIISVALRLFQFFQGFINPENGTWKETNLSISLLYIILAASSFLILIFTLISENMPKSLLPQRKSKALSIAGIVLTLGLILDALIQTSNMIMLREGSSAAFGLFLKENNQLPSLFQIIFALFGALYLLLFTLSYFKGKNMFSSSKILALAPTAWAISRLFTRFLRTDNFKNNSELLLELFMLCFIMLFFFAFSRISSQIGQENKMWLLFGSGFVGMTLSLVTSLPRLILMFAGRADLMVKDSPLEYADIAVAAFIGLLLFTIIKDYKSGKYEEYSQENASFNLIPVYTPEALTIDEVIPQELKKDVEQSNEDEAFKIAEQYSNQYIQSAKSPLDEENKDVSGDLANDNGINEETKEEDMAKENEEDEKADNKK